MAVKKYNKNSLDLLQFYEIDKKLDKIEEDWENRDELSRAKKLDNIDIQVTSLLLHTEKRYRKLRIGEVNFSPKVSKIAEI